MLPHCNQSPEKETVEETVENTLSVFLREGNITADRQKARNFLRPPESHKLETKRSKWTRYGAPRLKQFETSLRQDLPLVM